MRPCFVVTDGRKNTLFGLSTPVAHSTNVWAGAEFLCRPRSRGRDLRVLTPYYFRCAGARWLDAPCALQHSDQSCQTGKHTRNASARTSEYQRLQHL